MNTSNPSLDVARELDRTDPLAGKLDEFLLPADTIYLNGNSLGPLSRQAQLRAQDVVAEQWGNDLIASWNKHAWIDLPSSTAAKIAPIVGAAADQLICCDSVSINLIKLLTAGLELQSPRRVILSQQDNFPTDLYAAQGLERLLHDDRCELRTVSADEIIENLNEDVALLFLTQVNFRNGDRHDIERLSSAAKEKDILVIWDLSHSAGVIPLELDKWDVDFAVGCGYKFLNGGPGAPAFVYANRKHHAAIQQPIQGWMGHREPFEFDPNYAHGSGMLQFLVGTPPIVSLAVLDSSLEIFADVSVAAIHAKSVALSELFLSIVQNDEQLQCLALESNTDPRMRGAQLAFSHAEAYSICRALNHAGVVVDFRSPDLIRFGFSPLFLKFVDIWDASQILRTILSDNSFRAEEYSTKQKVT